MLKSLYNTNTYPNNVSAITRWAYWVCTELSVKNVGGAKCLVTAVKCCSHGKIS